MRAKGLRKVELELDARPEAAVLEAVPGVRDVLVEDRRVQLSYEGTMDALLKTVSGQVRPGRHLHPGGRPRRGVPDLLPRRGGDGLMLTTVFSKSLLDRWRGAAITVVSLSALLLFAMAAYREPGHQRLHRPARVVRRR
ncbi:MAG: hypothetical protein V9G09_04810 [Candidatus Nanopelagicales bacterium]